jgi:hypothetical protein
LYLPWKVAACFVGSVKAQGVALVHALKGLGVRDVSRLDQEMDVIAHEHIGIEAERMPRYFLKSDGSLNTFFFWSPPVM